MSLGPVPLLPKLSSDPLCLPALPQYQFPTVPEVLCHTTQRFLPTAHHALLTKPTEEVTDVTSEVLCDQPHPKLLIHVSLFCPSHPESSCDGHDLSCDPSPGTNANINESIYATSPGD